MSRQVVFSITGVRVGKGTTEWHEAGSQLRCRRRPGTPEDRVLREAAAEMELEDSSPGTERRRPSSPGGTRGGSPQLSGQALSLRGTPGGCRGLGCGAGARAGARRVARCHGDRRGPGLRAAPLQPLSTRRGSVPFPAAPGALGAARGQDPGRPGRSVTCGAGSEGREASRAIWVPRAAALPGGRGGAARGTAGGALAARGRVSTVHPEERSEAREFEEPAAPPAAVLGWDCCAHHSTTSSPLLVPARGVPDALHTPSLSFATTQQDSGHPVFQMS